MPLKNKPWMRPALLWSNVTVPLVVIGSGFAWPLCWAAFFIHMTLLCSLLGHRLPLLGPVATNFRTARRAVWLTIDDGPVGGETARLADELARRGVRATFFVKGKNLAANPEAARALLAAGHTLANHTGTHPILWFWRLWPGRLRREVRGCADALRNAGVTERRWFRSPFGMQNIFLHRLLAGEGLRLVAWSLRGRDGLRCEPAAVEARVVPHARPGDIILLHEGRPRSNEAILRVADALAARGFEFVIPGDADLF
jgi:peptidoglycan/xylan/chitin deacetylase (PgdA/CDA1 family)